MGEHKNITKGNNDMKSQAAKAAKEIRKELKAQFPGTKFSVITKNYAGGSSVTITYEDGPNKGDVERVARYWEAGTFNGMIDLYEYDSSKANMNTTKHVFVNREMSEETAAELEEKVRNRFEQPELELWKSFDINGRFTTLRQEMYKRFNK